MQGQSRKQKPWWALPKLYIVGEVDEWFVRCSPHFSVFNGLPGFSKIVYIPACRTTRKKLPQFNQMYSALKAQNTLIEIMMKPKSYRLNRHDVVLVLNPEWFNIRDLKRFFSGFNLNICFIAFWQKLPDIRSKILLSNARLYDANFVRSMSTKHPTKIPKIFGKMFESMLYPDYRFEINTTDIFDKEDIVVCVHNPYYFRNWVGSFELLREDFPEYKFVIVYAEKDLPDKKSLFELYKRAKLIISFSADEQHPELFLDAMRFGCIPLMPDMKPYNKLFPKHYLYNKKVIGRSGIDGEVIEEEKGRIYVWRRRRQIHTNIRAFMENHSDFVIQCVEEAETIAPLFYDFKTFIDRIYKIQNDRKQSLGRKIPTEIT